jgi:EAL domain-containing protein (putative c-di-GMP-specific phosphodiesterase class I)
MECSLLDRLLDQILMLRSKGFLFEEISKFLLVHNISLSAEVIHDYCESVLDKHVRKMEGEIEILRKPEWSEQFALIERGLRESITNDHGFVLHYQPQIDILTHKVVGAEALVRWEFNGSLVSSSDFIPVAENTGLINHIGEWVLREACKESKRWLYSGLNEGRGIKVSVNLSVKQFSNSLPNIIHGILCDVDLPIRLLGLEITESFLVGKESFGMLHALRESGLHMSIDDFGTGYSCLSQLKNLPLDTIKIDRAFVQDIHFGHTSAVVDAIISMANKMGMDTLAEGVETEEQASYLRNHGCTVFQGYLYSKPLPGKEFVAFAKGFG